MTAAPPRGITPPAPGLDREEPELRPEQDIPRKGGRPSAQPRPAQDREREQERSGDDRPLRQVERE